MIGADVNKLLEPDNAEFYKVTELPDGVVWLGMHYTPHGTDALGRPQFRCSAQHCLHKISVINGELRAYESRFHKGHVRHVFWSDHKVTRTPIVKQMCNKVSTSRTKSRQAYNSVCRDNYKEAESIERYEQVRKTIDRSKKDTFHPKLPKTKQEIQPAIENSAFSGNYYSMKIAKNKAIMETVELPEHEQNKIKHMNLESLQQELQQSRDKIWHETVRADYVTAVLENNYGGFDQLSGGLHLGGVNGEFQVFCSLTGAQILKACLWWLIDGTFKSTPRISPFAKHRIPYGQCWVINAVYKDVGAGEAMVSLPCIWVLMAGHDAGEAEYTAVLQFIIKKVFEVYRIDLSRGFHELMSDFEKGERLALKAIFPHWRIWGCGFHFTQAIVQNLKNFGLITLYRSNTDFWVYCRCFQMLMLLPERFVPIAFHQLKMMKEQRVPAESQEEFDLFLDYVQNTWFPYGNKQTSKQGYTIKDWNIFNALIRTNDLAEMQNFLIHSELHTHPDLFDFIEHIQNLAADCAIRYNQLIAHHTGNPRNPQEQKKNDKLKLLWSLIDQKQPEIDVITFLENASAIMKKKWKYVTHPKLLDPLAESKSDQ